MNNLQKEQATIIIKYLTQRNRSLAQNFLERFSPSKTKQGLQAKERLIKNPEFMAAEKRRKAKNDKLFIKYQAEINAFLKLDKTGLTSYKSYIDNSGSSKKRPLETPKDHLPSLKKPKK